MSYEFLKIERVDQVTIVTLNRPDALNALNSALMEEIEAVSHGFLDDEQTRAVLFMGAGRHFSAGADLKQVRAGTTRSLLMRRRETGLGARMIRAILDIDQVTVCAIHGAALGGAACIATACDFRVGSDDSGFLDQVLPASELRETALALAQRYAGQPPIAVQMIKQSINAVSSALDDAVMHMDTDQNLLTTTTEDRAEGIRAFFEKREPQFKGN